MHIPLEICCPSHSALCTNDFTRLSVARMCMKNMCSSLPFYIEEPSAAANNKKKYAYTRPGREQQTKIRWSEILSAKSANECCARQKCTMRTRDDDVVYAATVAATTAIRLVAAAGVDCC
jgi:hypothetical protein